MLIHIVRFLVAVLVCYLPVFASAATTCSIRAEWTSYVPPNGYIVSGYRLYQNGQLACQSTHSKATSIDCQVTLNTSTANFTLTALFTNGTESPHSTPFAFSIPKTTQANTPPTAVFTVSSSSGQAPLQVAFNGTSSFDSDGTIVSYTWNFGDGTTAKGQSASHLYSTAGSFTATLTVTDNQGALHSFNRTISVQSSQQANGLHIEAGEVSVSTSWARVTFGNPFNNPIVVAGPPSVNNSDPCVVRIRNITRTGFDIQLAEWNYQDGYHPRETVAYLVAEKGVTTLPDRSILEAGSFSGTTRFSTVGLKGLFTKTPIIFTTVASVNETDTLSGRIKDVGLSGFSYSFREQEKNRNQHVNETIHYIAWEPGKGSFGSLQFESAATGNRATNAWYTRTLQSTFKKAPVTLAGMQSTNDSDTAALRIRAITKSGFQVKVEEEQSLDQEVTHGAESVGFLAISAMAD